MPAFVKVAKAADVTPSQGKMFEVNGKKLSTPSMTVVLTVAGHCQRAISTAKRSPARGMERLLMSQPASSWVRPRQSACRDTTSA
jgi:hypothetical protein